MTKGTLLSCACMTAAIASCAAQPAWAQIAAQVPSAEQNNGVADIVVTAQRRTQNVQDVPLTVNAFNADAIRDRNVQSLQDITALTAGVKFNEVANVGNVSIRGVGTAIISGGGEGSAAIHIDGVYIAQVKAFPLAQFDLGGIEILRGPQGTLYGRNSTAGVVNIISQAPTSELKAGIFAQYGNYDQKRGGAYISGPIADGLTARLYVEGEDRNDYIYNSFTDKQLRDKRSSGIRFGLNWDGLTGLTSELRYTRAREHGAGSVQDAYYPGYSILPTSLSDFDPYKVSTPGEFDGIRKLDLVSWRNTIDVAKGIQLVALTGYAKFSSRNTFDVFGSLIPVPEKTTTDTNTFSQELILKGETPSLNWLVGAFYFHRKERNSSFADFTNLLGFVTDIQQSSAQSSLSGYADATYKIREGTRIFAGARVLREKLDQDLYDASTAGGVTTIACSPVTDPEGVEHTAVTGRVGIQQDVGANAMVYGQASRGYKAAGFSQSSCANAYKPETVNALELGLKSTLFDRKVRFNVSAFYNDISNLQIEIAAALGIPSANVPKSSSYGVEIEASFHPMPRLTIDSSLSLLHARYRRFINLDANLGVPIGTNLSGVPLNNAPDVSANVGAEYRFPVGAGSLTPRADVYITSKYNLREVSQPYTIQKGYTQTSLSLTYREKADDGYYIRGFVKNLENKAILAGVTAFGGVEGPFQPPRTYGVELGYNF